MPYSKLHEAAREYALNGWPVFPITPNSKIPLPGSNGFKDATTDLSIIDRWWQENPDANIGFCPDLAGLCVVDEDTDKGGKYVNKLYTDSEPQLATVKSPRGQHFYYSGSLPPTAGRISPNVDTRGQNSYVLLPPSIIEGKQYVIRKGVEFPAGSWEFPNVPGWVVELSGANGKIARPRDRDTNLADTTDRPQAIKLFKRYLEKNPIPPEGAGSDEAVYRAGAKGRDLGLSDDTIVYHIVECTSFDSDWIEGKLTNVEKYQQNEPGCDTPPTGQEAFGKFAANVFASPAQERAVELERDAWTPYDPRDPADMPELTYYDDDKFIPNSPDGAVGIIYGKRGEHKTNTIISMLTASRASRILYAAGEGAYGVERDRVPARPELAGRIKLLPRVPLFSTVEQVVAFIEGTNRIGYKPEVVVIDTMATALAGEDENSSVTASYLTDNGPCGMFKRAWNCTVILVAHAGKDATRGVRGSSGFEGNVDFLIRVEADKKNCVIKCDLEKMRDGYDGMSIYWKYEPEGVPVPAKISEKDYMKIVATAKEEKQSPVGMLVTSYLRLNGHHDWMTGIEQPDLAKELTIQELGLRPDDVTDAAEWDTTLGRWMKALKNARSSAWGSRCSDNSKVYPGGTKMTLRWFCPPESQDSPDM